MKFAHLISLLLLLSYWSCGNGPELPETGEVQGMRPIYFATEDIREIHSLPAQPIEELGKIYYKDEQIYVTERARGVHIIDNTDPANPERIRFLSIPGVNDVNIKNSILYADNVSDLVAIDISDLENIMVTKRIENAYRLNETNFPEGFSGFFECVDPSRGTIIGWESALLVNPQCQR